MYTDIPLKVIILSFKVELPLSVLGVGRRTQPIRKLLNELLITSALNPTCFLQSALNPTCLLQVNDVPTHLYLGSGSLISGEITSFCNNGEIIAVIKNDYYYFVSRLFEQFKISLIYEGTQYYEYVVHFHNINTCKGYQGFLWGSIQARDIIKRQWQEIHEEIGQHGLNSYFHA